MDNISGYIEQFVLDKLNTFNEGRNTDKGMYFILLPNKKNGLLHTLVLQPDSGISSECFSLHTGCERYKFSGKSDENDSQLFRQADG